MFEATSAGVGDPKSLFARFDKLGLDPASTMYVVGLPLAADHPSVTVDPLDDPMSVPGTPGAEEQPPPTTKSASFEVPLTPTALLARTRR